MRGELFSFTQNEIPVDEQVNDEGESNRRRHFCHVYGGGMVSHKRAWPRFDRCKMGVGSLSLFMLLVAASIFGQNGTFLE